VVVILAAATGALYQAMAERRDLSRFAAPGRRVDIGGRRLHLLCTGAGSPTVILEASGLASYRDWAKVQPELARLTRVCSYDRAGMGWSDRSPRPASAQAIVDDLRALLRAAQIAPPYVLVGHSAPAMATRLFAAEHPDEVRGLVLVDTAPEDLPRELPRVFGRMRASSRVGRVAVRLGLVRAWNPFHIDGEDRALTYRSPPFDAVASLVSSFPESARQLGQAPPLPHELPLVVLTHGRGGDWAGPGLIPPAEADTVEERWQAAQVRLAAHSARGRVVVAPNSGHMIPDEQPELVVKAVRDLLGR
jgi:pimeloyl-ACP methyl ester carboxylesterase